MAGEENITTFQTIVSRGFRKFFEKTFLNFQVTVAFVPGNEVKYTFIELHCQQLLT
jgi:hypothetical protein